MSDNSNKEWVLPASIPFDGLKRRDLEECVYWLLDAMGAKDLEWRTGGSGDGAADGGRDLEAHFYSPGADGEIESQKWWIECKGRAGTVESKEVKDALNNALAIEGLDFVVTGADEGIVLTCNGYTKDASKYAKSKNIKLAVLREIRESDWEGYIKTVVVNLYVQSGKNYATALDMSQVNHDLFTGECAQAGIAGNINSLHPVFFVRGGERVQFTRFLSEEVNRPPVKNAAGRWEVVTPPDGWCLQVRDGPLVQFNTITTSFDVDVQMVPITVTSNRIAELIIKGLGNDDIFIFGDQLERRKVDPETGEIL